LTLPAKIKTDTQAANNKPADKTDAKK